PARATRPLSSRTRSTYARCTSSSSRRRSCRTKPPEDPLHQAVEPVVQNEEVQAEEDRRQDDDDGCRVYLFLCRPRDAFELVAYFTEEQTRVLDAAARGLFHSVERRCVIDSHLCLLLVGPHPHSLAELTLSLGLERRLSASRYARARPPRPPHS